MTRKPHLVFWFFLGFGLGCSSSGHGNELDQLAWLEGSWKRESARGVTVERWQRVSELTFEGTSHRTAKATGERQLSESLLLVQMAGDVFYIPRPLENAYPVAFRLTALEDSRAVFENPTHDFPTKIIYERQPDGALLVSIEGPGEGAEPQRIDFPFTRVEP